MVQMPGSANRRAWLIGMGHSESRIPPFMSWTVVRKQDKALKVQEDSATAKTNIRVEKIQILPQHELSPIVEVQPNACSQQ